MILYVVSDKSFTGHPRSRAIGKIGSYDSYSSLPDHGSITVGISWSTNQFQWLFFGE